MLFQRIPLLGFEKIGVVLKNEQQFGERAFLASHKRLLFKNQPLELVRDGFQWLVIRDNYVWKLYLRRFNSRYTASIQFSFFVLNLFPADTEGFCNFADGQAVPKMVAIELFQVVGNAPDNCSDYLPILGLYELFQHLRLGGVAIVGSVCRS